MQKVEHSSQYSTDKVKRQELKVALMNRETARVGLAVVALAMTAVSIESAHAEQPAIQCGGPNIHGTYQAALSTYHVTTACSSTSVGLVNWGPQGSYDPYTGMAREDVQVGVVNGFAATVTTTGYMGWGTPENGRDPSRMVSLPGSYRISAQVASPHPTAWSPPVPFAVTSPKRAIQKAPKMFGQ